MPTKPRRLNTLRLVDAHVEIHNYAEVNNLQITNRQSFITVLLSMGENNYSYATILNRLSIVFTQYDNQYLGSCYAQQKMEELLQLKSEYIP